MRRSLWLTLISVFILSTDARAQHMYLDADGDGLSTVRDVLGSVGVSAVDIWIETDRNRDGSELDYARLQGNEATINSYEFILRASGGEVEWGEYINHQPTMTVPFGPLENASDYYHGFGGADALPAGKYKLGTLSLKVKSGSPELAFASQTPLWGVARTSFGSRLKGKDSDHTIKFTEDRTMLGIAPDDVPGDWVDAVGLGRARPESKPISSMFAQMPTSLEVIASPNPANPSATIHVRTTRQGSLHVGLYDLQGASSECFSRTTQCPQVITR